MRTKPLMPALGRQGKRISEFKASQVYRVSSRTARAIQRNSVLEKKKKKKKNRKGRKKEKETQKDPSQVYPDTCILVYSRYSQVDNQE